jgi:hypothetical protein
VKRPLDYVSFMQRNNGLIEADLARPRLVGFRGLLRPRSKDYLYLCLESNVEANRAVTEVRFRR